MDVVKVITTIAVLAIIGGALVLTVTVVRTAGK